VKKLKRRQGGDDKHPANIYAVCQSSTKQNLRTGKKLSRDDHTRPFRDLPPEEHDDGQ